MQDKSQKLRASIKNPDGWWASLFAGPIANKFLAAICDNPVFTPNRLTIFSLIIGLLAAVNFAIGTLPFLVIGGVLVQLSFIFDCMDGQLARYRNECTNFGAWFDRVVDRIKDFLYFISLAFGYFHNHYDEVFAWTIWPLSMTALAFVFLIEYYLNQNIELREKAELKLELTAAKKIGKQDPVTKLQIFVLDAIVRALKELIKLGSLLHKLVPILRFNIGEQSLLISLFCFFGAVMPMMVFFSILGALYSIYWPFFRIYGELKSPPNRQKGDYQI